MQIVDQNLFEAMARDQGEKFRTMIELSQRATDSDWTVIMDQIRYLAEQGLAYLKHFEDTDTEGQFDKFDNVIPL